MAEGRRMVLGGVEIPHGKGPVGHSDGDVLLHALADALLGAAALGDIGSHFPDTDARWKGADSASLLAHVIELVRERGFSLTNIDATVVAEEPKIGPHREAIRARLAEILSLPLDAVSVKAKTNEGLGDIGRGEAMACHAVVLLQERGGGCGGAR
jgi:2-C-methyl-D-erythritol 2,4-cyclodiphosphate synthase